MGAGHGRVGDEGRRRRQYSFRLNTSLGLRMDRISGKARIVNLIYGQIPDIWPIFCIWPDTVFLAVEIQNAGHGILYSAGYRVYVNKPDIRSVPNHNHFLIAMKYKYCTIVDYLKHDFMVL